MQKRLLISLLLTCSQSFAAPSLVAQRQALLHAVDQRSKTAPGHFCKGNNGEWHTDLVAFPAGAADRIYIFSLGAGSAYRIQAEKVALLWCGRADVWADPPTNSVLRAFGFPLKTVAGSLPREGPLDIFDSIGPYGGVATLRRNAAGQVVCRHYRPGGGELRTAFQFDARDTCP